MPFNMKHFFYIVILIFLSKLNSFAQEKDLLYIDNSFHEIFKANKVKKRTITTEKFEKGKTTIKYVENIQSFDTIGNLIKEREFYNADTTTGCISNFFYNSSQKLIKVEILWLDTKEWSLDKYQYNQDGKLILSCDYSKNYQSDEYVLDNCIKINYFQDNFNAVMTSKNDTINYFSKKGSKVYEYSVTGELECIWKNNRLICRLMDDNCYYKYNRLGQVEKAIIKDKDGELIRKVDFIYSNNLREKIIVYDKDKNITSVDIYEYDYY